MKSELKQCACIKCKNIQNELITYEQVEVNHILYVILTLIFLPLGILWYLKIQKSKEKTNANLNMAVSAIKCDKCGGTLMPISS